jgi:NADH-quinone oxidoreductase subunit G
MIKQNGEWQETDWQSALAYIVTGLKDIGREHGADAIATLVSPHSTLEEMALAAKLTRGTGLRQRRLPRAAVRFPRRRQAPWRAVARMPIAAVDKLDQFLVIGSFLRKDPPLLSRGFAMRSRKARRSASSTLPMTTC